MGRRCRRRGGGSDKGGFLKIVGFTRCKLVSRRDSVIVYVTNITLAIVFLSPFLCLTVVSKKSGLSNNNSVDLS